MSLSDDFITASENVKNLPQRPNNDTLLKLYSLFKQGSVGDAQGKRPGMLDIKGRAKYDAWSHLKGMSSKEAQQHYIDLVDQLSEE